MPSSAADLATPEAVSLKAAMHRLWSDHVIWTRDYIIAAVAGAPDAEAAANRRPPDWSRTRRAIAVASAPPQVTGEPAAVSSSTRQEPSGC